MTVPILVTGAAGFTGRGLCDRLRSCVGGDVAASTRSGGDGAEACDLLDAENVSALIHRIRPRRIFHCAGSFSNSWSVDLPNNVQATANILAAVCDAAPKARILLLGSAAEYGPSHIGPISESTPLKPASVYGTSKAMQSRLMEYFYREKNLDVILARPFNLYGDGISPALFPGTINDQIRAVLRGQKDKVVVKSLASSRDYLPLGKALDAYLRIMEHGASGDVYNVGSGFPTPIRSLLETMLSENGLSMDHVEVLGCDSAEEKSPAYADIQKLLSLPTI